MKSLLAKFRLKLILKPKFLPQKCVWLFNTHCLVKPARKLRASEC